MKVEDLPNGQMAATKKIEISSLLFLKEDLVVLPSVWIFSSFYEILVAMDVDVEILVQLEHAFEDPALLLYRFR